MKAEERSILRSLVQIGRAIDVNQGTGDRLVRYGLVRANGSLFSEAFGDWIREYGGAI